jgi:hypothetical protein
MKLFKKVLLQQSKEELAPDNSGWHKVSFYTNEPEKVDVTKCDKVSDYLVDSVECKSCDERCNFTACNCKCHKDCQPDKEWDKNYKQCLKCKERKPKSEFYKRSASADGFYQFCKVCFRPYDKARYIRDKKKRLAYCKLREQRPEIIFKNKARVRLRQAVKMGRIIKPTICDEVKFKGATPCRGSIEAHHFRGYVGDHAFDVLWLCKEHHMEAHYG